MKCLNNWEEHEKIEYYLVDPVSVVVVVVYLDLDLDLDLGGAWKSLSMIAWNLFSDSSAIAFSL